MDNTKMDRLLYLVAPYAGQPELDIYNNSILDFKPSPKFVSRMKRFLKRVNRKEQWEEWKSVTTPLKRVAIAVMLVCTISLGFVLSIKAVREAIWKVVINWFDDYVEITFVDERAEDTEEIIDINTDRYTDVDEEKETSEDTQVVKSDVPAEILVYKEPTAIDGFERYEMGKLSYVYCIEYESATDFFRYEQTLLGEFPKLFTNSNTLIYEIDILGYSGTYLEYFQGETKFIALTWNDGQYQYTLNGTINIDELIVIAESLKNQTDY